MSLPTPPSGILDRDQPWYRGKISDAQYDRLKAKLTGGRDAGGTSYSKLIDCSPGEADKIISNMKKDPRGYPQMYMPGGGEAYQVMIDYYQFLKDAYLYDEPKPEPENIPVEVEVVEVEQTTVDEPIVVKIEAPFESTPEVKLSAPKRIKVPRRSGVISTATKKSTAERMGEAFTNNLLNPLVDSIQNPPAPAPQKQRKQKESLVKIRRVVTPKVNSTYKESRNVKPAENTGLFLLNKTKNAFKRAADIRRMANEAGMPQQDKGFYFKRALGNELGGDAIARTRGTFSSNPDATLDPALTKQQRLSEGIFGTRTIRKPQEQKVDGDINNLTKKISEIDKKFDSILKTKSKGSDGTEGTDTLEKTLEQLKNKLQSGNKHQKDINASKKKLLTVEAKAADQAQAAAEQSQIGQGEDLSKFEDMYQSPEKGGEKEQDGGGGFDLFDKLKKFKAGKWLRRLRKPGKLLRSLGRLNRMRAARFIRPIAQFGKSVATGVKGLATGAAATSAAIVGGVGLAASGIGEGIFALTKKGGAGEQTRDALKKKGEEIGGPMGSLIGGVGNLAGISTEATKVTGNALDAIGAPFRYAIEGIRYPFLNEEDREKQAENLGKFDARIREYSRGWMNRIDFMNVVPDEKGGFGNIYGDDDAQKDMMEKMAEGGTIPEPKFQGIGGARLIGDLPAAGPEVMTGEAGNEMVITPENNPLQSLAPMIVAMREVTKRAGTWADPVENMVRQITDPIAKKIGLPTLPTTVEIGQNIPDGNQSNMKDEKKGLLGRLVDFLRGKDADDTDDTSSSGPSGAMGMTLSGSAADLVGNDHEFLAEVTRLSQKYQIKEGDLLALMASESGLDPHSVNSESGATGLIQFIPSTARGLGTTTSALLGMNRAQQMKYVEKFFDQAELPKGATAGQLYATVIAPAYATKDPDTKLYTRADGAAYTGNQALDTNNDGAITVREMGGRLEQKKAEFGISDSGVSPVAPQALAPATPPPVAAPNPIVIMPIVGAGGPPPPQPVAPSRIPMTETGQVDWMKMAQQQRLAGS